MPSTRPHQHDDPQPEFDRLAVVAIQGGGVYGLNMLGQLSAVRGHHAITPMAFAGTSAGAVVAALSWAGYSPKQIRALFVGLSVESVGPAGRETVVDLLGPFEPRGDQFDYDRFKILAGTIRWAGGWVAGQVRGSPEGAGGPEAVGRAGVARWRIAGVLTAVAVGVFGSALRAAGWIGWGVWSETVVAALLIFGSSVGVRAFRVGFAWVRAVAGLAGAIREVWLAELAPFGASAALIYEGFLSDRRATSPHFAPRTVAAAKRVIRGYREILTLAFDQRGFFAGNRFEAFLDRSLKESPTFAPFREELGEAPLTFGRVKQLWRDHEEDHRVNAIVPLILTATNLTTRELVLITSYEDRFDAVSIARAVRASAGFPVFFKPVDLAIPGAEGWYVDGGVIANFPSWVFSRNLRRQLAGVERYRDLASRPWLNLGLRVVSDRPAAAPPTEDPGEFLASMVDFARSQVRDELEKALTAGLPRAILVEQPVSQTNAPANILDVSQLTDDKIRAMFTRGEEFAEERLRRYSFKLPSGPEARAIEAALEGLVRRVLVLFGQADNQVLQLRANVFLPESQTLFLRYGYNMDQADGDRTITLDYNAGLTGFCFNGHRPYLCNLIPLRAWAEQTKDPGARLLGMTPSQHLGVRPDRTWLASVPVFDPMDCWFVEGDSPRRIPETGDLPVWSELPATLDGALFGVLNLDAAMPYADLKLAENTEDGLTDPRTTATFNLMQACSFELALVFSRAFAKAGSE